MKTAAQQYQEGLIPDDQNEREKLVGEGYHPCANQLCPFLIGPDVLEVAQSSEYFDYQCSYCGQKQNLMATPGKQPDQFTPGGVTQSGLTLDEFGDLGEQIVQDMGSIPGYGPIIWWSQAKNSYLDGAVSEWGVEVKTLNASVKNRRMIVKPLDRVTKQRAALDPKWFSEQLGDPKLSDVLHKLHFHGILGVLVILDMATSLADIYVREMPLYSDVQTQELKGVIHVRDKNATLVASQVPFQNPLENPQAPGFVPFGDRAPAVEAEPFGAFSRTADMIGDSHPGQEPQAVSDIDNRYSPNEWDLGPAKYRFSFENGQLEVEPLHNTDSLHNGAGGDINAGPRVHGSVTVDRGRATWNVAGNVAVGAIAKVLQDYSHQVGWDWGGLTDHQGESISDELAPKKAIYYVYSQAEDHLYLASSPERLPAPEAAGVLVKRGATVDVPQLDRRAGQAVLEWATDQGLTLVGANDNVIKTIEDLEQWNWSDPNPAEPRGQYDREPTGVFKCPDCGRLFPRWRNYLLHRQEEEPPGDPVEDGKFPEIEENAIEDAHFTPQERWNSPVGKVTYVVQGAPAPPEGKDLIEDAVPFIYDIEKDAIYVGQPAQTTHDIEMGFTPGGIVEGTYEPGGKVIINTVTTHPYSLRHLIDLWYNQHPEFEVKGLYKRDNEGKEKKLAAAPSDLAGELRVQAKNDPAVWGAYQALKQAGGKTYIVGGAVRDALKNGQPPKDIDLLVQGVPSAGVRRALEALPGRVDLTGKDFGVYRYRHAGHEVEIALPRKERSTGEGHQDFDVKVDHTMPITEDLERRDFTVNAMAVDMDDGELIDPYNGQKDLRDGTLKIVHPRAFDEDPLRVVRALVAASRHGLRPDDRTKADMRRAAVGLNSLAPERIQAELDKLLASRDPESGIRLAHDTGVLGYMLPEVERAWDFDQNNPHHEHTLGEHLMQVLRNTTRLTDDPDVRLAALLHDIGKPDSAWTNPDTGFSHYYRGPDGQGLNHDAHGAVLADQRLRALRYPNQRVDRIRGLVEHHMYPDFSSPAGARKFLNRVGEHADDLLHLREADREGHGTPEQQGLKTPVQTQRDLVSEVRNSQEPTERSMLAINGNDLIQAGMTPGPELGQALNRLTQMVVEDPKLNTREQLLELAFA